MTGVIAVLPTHTFFNNNGTPCANGRLHVIGANTSPPSGNLPSWIDKAQTIVNTNPIILDALGQCSLWLEAGKVYDLILKDDQLGANTGTPGSTIRTYEDVSGASSALIAPTQWVVTGLTPSFANSRTFTVVGDQTSIYSVGRRVRTLNTGGIKYGTIIASVYGVVTTVTLGFQNNTDAIDSGISSADVGLETIENPALQVGDGSIIDMSSYAGTDIKLAIGQTCVYNIVSVTSLALRIATGDNQSYTLDITYPFRGGALNATSNYLQPNNTLAGALTVIHSNFYSTNAMNVVNIITNIFPLDGGNVNFRSISDICTNTTGKNMVSRYTGHNGSQETNGQATNVWNDAITVWSSLGTLQFNASTTARVLVKRVS